MKIMEALRSLPIIVASKIDKEVGRNKLIYPCRSLLLDLNTPLNTVQMRAGHSKDGVTVDIYGYALARTQAEATDKIEELVIPIPVKLQ